MKPAFDNKAAFSRTLPRFAEAENILNSHCPETPGVHWSAAARQTEDTTPKSDFKILKNKPSTV